LLKIQDAKITVNYILRENSWQLNCMQFWLFSVKNRGKLICTLWLFLVKICIFLLFYLFIYLNLFLPTKGLALFSIHTPQKPSFKPINHHFIVAGMC